MPNLDAYCRISSLDYVLLVANLDRLKLDVETIIPIHYPADSRKVTIAELNRAVGKGN